ncbi:MAG: L-histidine N(alpha)-methyltransferase, partial [Spirochaetota bacterium]
HSFPDISIRGAVADFVKQFDQIKSSRRCVFCLFGSTLGNLPRHLAVDFCTRLGAHMRPGDAFLLGVDMVKDRAVLHSAYNDSSRVTSRFNLNILRVVNSILGSDFNPKHFAHRAFFNEEQLRIEMHLEALRDMTVTCTVTGDSLFLDKGETIHTENSHKFTKELIRDLARSAGLGISAVHTDANEWFSLVHLEKQQ